MKWNNATVVGWMIFSVLLAICIVLMLKFNVSASNKIIEGKITCDTLPIKVDVAPAAFNVTNSVSVVAPVAPENRIMVTNNIVMNAPAPDISTIEKLVREQREFSEAASSRMERLLQTRIAIDERREKADADAREVAEKERQASIAKANAAIEIRRIEEAGRLEQARKDAMKALLLINHVNWTVAKVKSHNDPAVLEELYASISQDAILLDQIKDQEIVDLFCDVMDVITDMRIEAKEREFLKDELDQGMSDALFDAFSSVSVGGGMSPVGMAINLLTSAATAGMNYKQAKSKLMAKFKKQEWGLDKNRMIYLNDLNKSLFKKYWAVIQRHGIPDPFRVTEADIARLIERMKSTNAGRRHRFLLSETNTYSALPVYWYYRGQAAFECGDINDAKEALDGFLQLQSRYGKILRRDPTAVSVALLRAQILIKEERYGDELRNQLRIVEENYDKNDWQKMYFCASVYAGYLDDFANAERVLRPVIDRLEDEKQGRLVDWQALVEEKRSGSTNVVGTAMATGDALFACKTMLVRMAGNKLSKERIDQILQGICDDDNASAREKLFCYGSMGFAQALRRLKPDLIKIRVRREGSKAEVHLPLSWIKSREGKIQMHYGNGQVGWNCEFNEPNWVNVDESGTERTIVMDEEHDSVVLTFEGWGNQKSCALTFLYDIGGEEKTYYYVVIEFSEIYRGVYVPCRAQLGNWVVGGMGKDGMPTKGHWRKDESGNDIADLILF